MLILAQPFYHVKLGFRGVRKVQRPGNALIGRMTAMANLLLRQHIHHQCRVDAKKTVSLVWICTCSLLLRNFLPVQFIFLAAWARSSTFWAFFSKGRSTIFPSSSKVPDPCCWCASKAAARRMAWAIASSDGVKADCTGSTCAGWMICLPLYPRVAPNLASARTTSRFLKSVVTISIACRLYAAQAVTIAWRA